MEIPSLFKISTDAVTKYMAEGDYDNLNFKLPPKMGNEIFTRITEKPPYLLKQIQGKLTLSKIDISRMEVSKGVKNIVKAQKNLEALTFTIRKEEVNDNEFDLTSFMTELLDESSKRSLKFLKISSHQRVYPLWAPSLSKVFPNLETLVVPRITFDSLTFLEIRRSFANLKILDVGSCKITSLKGISNLKNLEVLCIRNIEFRAPEDMIELFECRKLRMLDLSKSQGGESKIVENYLKCGKVLHNLRFLDCDGTDIDKSMLEQLVKTHKNLKQVVVLDTILNYSTFPGIDLLNCASPESLLKTFQHFISIRRNEYIEWMLDEILEMLDRNVVIELRTQIGLTRSICESIGLFKQMDNVYDSGMQCLMEIASEQNLKFWTPPDIEFLASQLVKIGTDIMGTKEDVVYIILEILNQESILECPVLNLTNISRYVMSLLTTSEMSLFECETTAFEFMILGKLHYKWTPEHIDVLFKTEESQFHMLHLLHCLVASDYREENFQTYRNEFKMSLKVLQRVTETSEEACRYLLGRPNMHLVELLLDILNTGGKSMALGTLVNLMRMPEFMISFGKLLVDKSRVFVNLIQEYFLQFDKSPDTILHSAFYSTAILSFLMVNTNRGDEFWTDASLLISIFCGLIDNHSDRIPKNLDIFLKSSLLVDCIQNLNDDGPKSWALLTGNTMLKRDGSLAEKFMEPGVLQNLNFNVFA